MKILPSNTVIEEDVKTTATSPSTVSNTIVHDTTITLSGREPRQSIEEKTDSSQATMYDPPITVAMLKELDSDTLTASVQIRHDLALEPMLKLRPNSQRRSSAAYQNDYRQYWVAMEQELQLLPTNRATPHRLIRCLEEIKKLIINCYPNSSAVLHSMSEVFDVNLLQHQIINGTLSLEPFMQEIARILKKNCAPRRDSLVDHLVELARTGNYVVMIREFFEILELMKLDLANYHLHSLKSTPVEVVAKLERDYFKKEMEHGTRSLESVRSWLPNDGDVFTFDLFKTMFAAAFVDKKAVMPETWYLDASRIVTYRNEMQLISICASMLSGIRKLCGKGMDQQSVDELKSRLLILINSPKTKVKDLSDGILIILNRLHVTGELVDNCESVISRLIRPDSPLFLTVQKRVHDVIVAGIADPTKVSATIIENKLSAWESELTQLIAKINKMQVHHWTVFHELYQSI